MIKVFKEPKNLCDFNLVDPSKTFSFSFSFPIHFQKNMTWLTWLLDMCS